MKNLETSIAAISGLLLASAALAQPSGPRIINGAEIVVLGNATIDATSRIDVSGKGFGPGCGPGGGVNAFAGNGITGAPNFRGSGAGHGGVGGAPFGVVPAAASDAYGDYRWPVEFGSGGGSASGGNGCSGQASTGAGGGAVALFVAGTLQLDGDIIANGTGTGAMSGGGSGGSILITAGVLAGDGALEASGGGIASGVGLCGGGGGAGAGGRIAVYATDASLWTGIADAHAGDRGNRGGAGTILLSFGNEEAPLLIVDNFGAGGGFVGGNGITPLEDGAVGRLRVLGGARLGPPAGETAISIAAAARVTIDATSSLSASELMQPGSGVSPGASDTAAGGGAGHGGNGGDGGTNGFDDDGDMMGGMGGGAYGENTLNPPTRGSGGGAKLLSSAPASTGGTGGGFVALNVAGQLLLNGAVSADAQQNTPGNAGGGSGGGVLVRAASIIGNGSMQAIGGPGGGGNPVVGGTSGGGGGAGGRVAWATCEGPIDGNIQIDVLGGPGGVGNGVGQGGDLGTAGAFATFSDVRHDPVSQNVLSGTVAQFVFVAPTGSGSTFSWTRDGAPIADGVSASGAIITGTSGPVLTILFPDETDEALFRCTASGPCGATISDAALLTVTVPGPLCPGDFNNDQFVDFNDLNVVLSGWNQEFTFDDLNLVLANWLEECFIDDCP